MKSQQSIVYWAGRLEQMKTAFKPNTDADVIKDAISKFLAECPPEFWDWLRQAAFVASAAEELGRKK